MTTAFDPFTSPVPFAAPAPSDLDALRYESTADREREERERQGNDFDPQD